MEVSSLMDVSVLSGLRRALTMTVPLVAVKRAVLLRARVRQSWWPSHAVVYTEAQILPFVPQGVRHFPCLDAW